MMTPCPQHDKLAKKIDDLVRTQTRLVTLLEEAVVKKDDLYREINKIRSESRKTIGILTGVLIVLGGALQALLKTL